MTDRLSPDQLAYNRFVLAQLTAVQSAFEVWRMYLAQVHQLGPGDRVEDDGTIVRAAQRPTNGAAPEAASAGDTRYPASVGDG